MITAHPDTPGVIAPPPLLFMVPLVAGLLAQRRRPLPWLPKRLRRPIGLPLIGLGLAGMVWFVRTMLAADTPFDPREPARHLATSGPFRLSRNPSYLSDTLIYVGVAAWRNSAWPLIFLPGVLALVQKGVIEREERHLERRFGGEYRAYRARVRRWL